MNQKYPHGFLSLAELCPEILIEANYSTPFNFTGEIVSGYKAKKALLAEAPAMAVLLVQKKAMESGLTLKVFDSYRPTKAVAFFQEWAQRPENNYQIQEIYYPGFTRKELFEHGYIAKRSTHSRGSALDLTLADAVTGQDLNMGSAFDFFGEISNTNHANLTPDQKGNRLLLKKLMEEGGFRNYSLEWWHYSFLTEPFPETYFDFDVE